LRIKKMNEQLKEKPETEHDTLFTLSQMAKSFELPEDLILWVIDNNNIRSFKVSEHTAYYKYYEVLIGVRRLVTCDVFDEGNLLCTVHNIGHPVISENYSIDDMGVERCMLIDWQIEGIAGNCKNLKCTVDKLKATIHTPKGDCFGDCVLHSSHISINCDERIQTIKFIGTNAIKDDASFAVKFLKDYFTHKNYTK